MGNFIELFFILIIGIAVIAFIIPDQGKSRTKSAKNAVKTEFPNILKLLFLGALLVGLISIFKG